MITYNDIYDAERKEKYSKQLQKLPANFISEVAKYLKEKREMANREDDVFSDVIIKNKKQLENARILFKNLLFNRRKKILDLVLIAGETGISKKDFDNMLNFEKNLFEDMMKCVELADKRLNEAIRGKEEEKEQNTLVSFVENVEEFVSGDGEMMGPYNKGDVANIPNDISEILLSENKVEILEKY